MFVAFVGVHWLREQGQGDHQAQQGQARSGKLLLQTLNT